MPNWCTNKLVVNNGDKISPELKSYLSENKFSFNKVIPVTEVTIDAQNSAWDTKWDLDEREQYQCSNELIDNSECFFDTAWSPPMKVIEELSKMFPMDTFTLYYYESGMGFAGCFYADEGVCVDDTIDFYNKEEHDKFIVECMGWEVEDE